MMPVLRRTPALLLAAMALAVAAAGAVQATTVSVLPADTAVTVTDSFAVRVATDAVPDLRGFELIFSFDSSIIQLIGVAPGGLVTASGNPYAAYLVPDGASPVDSIWYDVGMLGWSGSGPGVLAFFHFKALQVGVSPVHCEWVDFRDSYNVRTLPACQSGLVRVTGPVPAPPETCGGIKALYR